MYTIGTKSAPVSLFGHHAKRGYALKSRTIDETTAVRMVARLDDMLADVRPAVYASLDVVCDEIAALAMIRDADPLWFGQRALSAGISSSGMRFALNVAIVQRYMRAIDAGVSLATWDEVYAVIRDTSDGGPCVGSLTVGRVTTWLVKSRPYVGTLDVRLMGKDALLALKDRGLIAGIADKTAAFTAHMFDAYAPVYTLDVHMLRMLCHCYDGIVAGGHDIKPKAYVILEAAMVDWSTRNFPNVPTFAVQWAIWNACGHGYHVSHLPMYAV